MSKKQILILILVVSAFLRLGFLSRGDTVNDEVFMSFRGIGMMDFDEATAQTTPWEWTDPNIPWWAHLSFHDHPLLVPATENIFMKIFGENNFSFRLPSALLGITSVYLLYLLGAVLYSENVGLYAAGLFGVTLNNVYISRTGMQEPYVIFFLLLASYLFLKSLRKSKYLLWLGLIIGLAAEAKYNSLILIPIFLTYLAVYKRGYFREKNFWYGAGIFILIFSPTIIYNIELYRNFGHFDFQFSSILGKRPEVWKIQPGKEIGTLGERIQNFAPRLIASNSWLFLLLAATAFLTFFTPFFKNFKLIIQKNFFLLIVCFWLLFLLLVIGPSYRFLTILTPFLALLISLLLNVILEHTNRLKYAGVKKNVLIIFLAIFSFEIFYSVNNQIFYYPTGPAPWLSSKVRYENYNWGYNELADYLDKELGGKMPGITFDLRYQFLEKLREKALKNGQESGLEIYPALFVYEGNFDGGSKLWVLDRLHIYHAWPIISLQTYYNNLQQNGFDYFDRVGFKNYYFILGTNIVESPEMKPLERGNLIKIYNKRGDLVFNIYKF